MTAIFKWIAVPFYSPMLFGLLLALAGFWVRRTRRRLGIGFLVAAAIIVFFGSTTLIGNALLGPLERSYPPLASDQAANVKYIVVLGSGYEPEDGVPVTGALDADGLARIVEGVRLLRERPDATLMVSGGAPPGRVPAALGYARLAEQLGITQERIVILDSPRDTAEEARRISSLLASKPFILVTSAFHMPRAMRLMRRAGLNAIPASTANLVHPHSPSDRFGLIPSSRGLHRTEIALHEYVGIVAIALQVYH
ncbi:MAG TPA: ElyC/SanA/YdcF family protein [Steroidobacteraceae bacterium]